MFEFDSMEAISKNAIEKFKDTVRENAKRVGEAWEKGINEWAIESADLQMIDYYVNFHNANREELKEFVLEAYAAIVLN